MAYCPNCKKELPEGSDFCPDCGRTAEAPENKEAVGMGRLTFFRQSCLTAKAVKTKIIVDGKTVAAADCLVPGIGEIIGGSQREERLSVLEARMDELGLKKEDYWWYLDLRRYGSCRHAGYGLGFERLVMYLTGVSNIRDVELHPRTTGNADF